MKYDPLGTDEDDGPPLIRESNAKELLPAIADSVLYDLEKFVPVSETDDDQQTTIADLSLLNNQLAFCSAALPKIHTVQGLCTLSNTICKLIETRRRVKKLPLGEPAGGKGGRVFEVLE